MKDWVVVLLIGLAMIGIGLWAVWANHEGPEWAYWSLAGWGSLLTIFAGLESIPDE